MYICIYMHIRIYAYIHIFIVEYMYFVRVMMLYCDDRKSKKNIGRWTDVQRVLRRPPDLVLSHMKRSHVTHMKRNHATHVKRSHVTHMKRSPVTHLKKSHVTHTERNHVTYRCISLSTSSVMPKEVLSREVGGWGRVPFSRNLMKPTPRRKWYLTTGRRFH